MTARARQAGAVLCCGGYTKSQRARGGARLVGSALEADPVPLEGSQRAHPPGGGRRPRPRRAGADHDRLPLARLRERSTTCRAPARLRCVPSRSPQPGSRSRSATATTTSRPLEGEGRERAAEAEVPGSPAEALATPRSLRRRRTSRSSSTSNRGASFPNGLPLRQRRGHVLPARPLRAHARDRQGSSSGVRLNSPVMSGDGLVGHVSNVFPDTALVRLLTDRRPSSRPVTSTRRVRGMVHTGPGGTLILDQVEKQLKSEGGRRARHGRDAHRALSGPLPVRHPDRPRLVRRRHGHGDVPPGAGAALREPRLARLRSRCSSRRSNADDLRRRRQGRRPALRRGGRPGLDLLAGPRLRRRPRRPARLARRARAAPRQRGRCRRRLLRRAPRRHCLARARSV